MIEDLTGDQRRGTRRLEAPHVWRLAAGLIAGPVGRDVPGVANGQRMDVGGVAERFDDFPGRGLMTKGITRAIACLLIIMVSGAVQAAQAPGKAAIASAHYLATEAGHEILAQGGNAFDAAIAVSAALAVVEPTSSGIGGGAFWLLHRASDGFQTMIDAREQAPAAADLLAERRGTAAHLRKNAIDLVEAPPGELSVATVNKYLEIKARHLL